MTSNNNIPYLAPRSRLFYKTKSLINDILTFMNRYLWLLNNNSREQSFEQFNDQPLIINLGLYRCFIT